MSSPVLAGRSSLADHELAHLVRQIASDRPQTSLNPAIKKFFAFLSIRLVVVRRRSSRETVSTDVPTQLPNEGGTKMMRQFLACGLVLTLLLTLSSASYGDAKPGAKLPAPPTNAGLEKMKKLAGTWLAADEDGKPTDQVVSIIKVTAGGSAVHETLFPGQPQEMVSIYTADGPD